MTPLRDLRFRARRYRPDAWFDSALRGARLTSVLGLVLLIGVPILFVTGLVSYAAYNPDLGGRFNDPTPGKGLLGFYLFPWPTRPAWLYQLTQGVHVYLGLALVPILLAKLWSVIPLLFTWPPVRSVAHALERFSVLLLVGGGLFVFLTGIANIQYWYGFPGGFYAAHFYGAWVFIAALALHVALKLPVVWRTLRKRDLTVDATVVAEDDPSTPAVQARDDTRTGAPAAGDDLGVSSGRRPALEQAFAPGAMTRRGLFGMLGGASLLVLLTTVGQSLGGPLRRLALFAPRGGTDDFPVNKTAASRGITAEMTGPDWRLELHGPNGVVRLSRDELLAMPLHTERLPLACVEGWATVQDWTGVRLADLARRAGVPRPHSVLVESLQKRGGFGSANLRGNQVLDPRSLLALQANGRDLSLDHGYPARIIVPNNPGVHQTKWVSRLTFRR